MILFLKTAKKFCHHCKEKMLVSPENKIYILFTKGKKGISEKNVNIIAQE